jgi:hypothetical protein
MTGAKLFAPVCLEIASQCATIGETAIGYADSAAHASAWCVRAVKGGSGTSGL